LFDPLVFFAFKKNMAGNFGMLSEGYFLGRLALVDWVNNFLECHIEKVEDCASGALYCNLWDALHPNTIQMSKVDFTVKQEFEYMKNWKVLQEAFQKAGVKKTIPVEKLIKGKYQDNLEFLQWMYQYAHQVYNGDCDNPQYNALERRSKSKGGKEYAVKLSRRQFSNPRTRENNSNNTSHVRDGSTSFIRQTSNNNIHTQNQSSILKSEPFVIQQPSQSKYMETHFNNRNNESNDDSKREFDELRQENSKLQTQNTILENKLESLSDVAKDIEKERDFYFNKVLKIESILKEFEDQSMPLVKTIFDILYQVDEENVNNENKNTDNIPDIGENK